jgi:RND family efflux transporter MFP subunit
MKNFILRKSFLIPVGMVVLVLLYFGLKNGKSGETYTVERGDILQYVMATGKVVPNEKVDLGFDRSGRVASVNFFVGDFVRRGDVIALLEAGETSSEIIRAEAVLDEEILRLREIERSAPLSFNDSIRSLEVAIREMYASADNAVRNRADQFFKNVPDNPRFEISFSDGNFVHFFPVSSNTQTLLNNDRRKVEEILNYWKIMKVFPSKGDIYSNAEKAIEDMKEVLNFLDNVALAVNTFSPAEFQYETVVNNYKANISSARSDVSRTLSNLISARDRFNSSPQFDVETGEYKDVLIQRQRVEQARANLSSLGATLGRNSIRAPFDGVITVQDSKAGAIVSPGNSLVSITSQNDIYIEANISEINIGKINQGDIVHVELDAFPNEVFEGFVSLIEPGSFVVDGVVNFKIRVELNNSDQRIKNGLTSNLKIQTNKKEGVLRAPLYAIKREGNESFVQVRAGKDVEKVFVKLGVSGNDSFVEILEGVKLGDILVLE